MGVQANANSGNRLTAFHVGGTDGFVSNAQPYRLDVQQEIIIAKGRVQILSNG
jgi:hypothetical protein